MGGDAVGGAVGGEFSLVLVYLGVRGFRGFRGFVLVLGVSFRVGYIVRCAGVVQAVNSAQCTVHSKVSSSEQ